MKKHFWILILLPFLMTCQKGDDNTIEAKGVLLGKSSQQPLSGVTLHLYRAEGDATDVLTGKLRVKLLQQQTTSGDGRYYFKYDKNLLPNDNTPLYLGCTNYPNGYQPLVEYGGQLYDLRLDPDDFYYPTGVLLQVQDNLNYTIYFLP